MKQHTNNREKRLKRALERQRTASLREVKEVLDIKKENKEWKKLQKEIIQQSIRKLAKEIIGFTYEK